MRPISWPQAFISVACFLAIGLSHYAGPTQGTLISVVIAFFLWLREPPKGPPPPAVLKAAVGVAMGLLIGQILLACR